MVMQKVVIIGAGELGKAIGAVIAQRADVSWWDKDPARVGPLVPLAEIIPRADVVLLCVPSDAIREMLRAIAPHLQKEAVVAVFAKGLEDSGARMDEVLRAELSTHPAFAIIGGPLLAEELVDHRGGVGALATESEHAREALCMLFDKSTLFLAPTDDMAGVALSGVLKNIYAIAFGIADACLWGSNRRGWLFAESVREMAVIVGHLGGRLETAYEIAGIADLFATGGSSYSRNRAAGEALASSESALIKGEGIHSLTPLVGLLGEAMVARLPIFSGLCDVLKDRSSARQIFERVWEASEGKLVAEKIN